MQGVEEQEPQFGHFIQWTPRTRAKSSKPEIHQFNAKSFDTLKAVIFRAFAQLPEARQAFCAALAEFTRLTSIPQAATP